MSQQNIISGNPFSFYLQHIIKTELEQKEQEVYWQIDDTYSSCFFEAKENNMPEADLYYEKAVGLNYLITPKIKLWVAVFCDPYLSYYYYKHKKYDKAVSVTHEIIGAIQALRNQGYQYLFFCEIQQVHNLSRICFAENNIQQAIEICVQCLFNIYRQGNNWWLGKFINDVPEKDLIETTQHGMIVQILTETFGRIINLYKSEVFKIDAWLEKFITPLVEINFDSIAADERYKNYDTFLRLFKKIIDKGLDEIDDSDLIFIKSKHVDKGLLKIIYKYIDIVSSQIQEQPELAVA